MFAWKDCLFQNQWVYQVWRDLNMLLSGKKTWQPKEIWHLKCLYNINFGIFTKEDVFLLSLHIVYHCTFTVLQNLRDGRFQIFVNTNSIWSEINWSLVGYLSRALGISAINVFATLNHHVDKKCTIIHDDFLVKSADNQANNLLVNIAFLSRIAVRLRQNICIHLYMQNGSPTEIIVCNFQSATNFKKSKIFHADSSNFLKVDYRNVSLLSKIISSKKETVPEDHVNCIKVPIKL